MKPTCVCCHREGPVFVHNGVCPSCQESPMPLKIVCSNDFELPDPADIYWDASSSRIVQGGKLQQKYAFITHARAAQLRAEEGEAGLEELIRRSLEKLWTWE